MSLYRNQLEAWLKNIEVECDKVLDVGGGELPIKKRVKSFNVNNYKVLDNDAQFAPDYFADLNYPLMLQEHVMFESQFNVLFCLEVFEYIWNPSRAMENLWHLLVKDGVAYISFPTIYPLHNPPGIDYLRYTKNAVEKLLEQAGFRTWEITPRKATTGAGYLRDFYMSEGMHPMRNTDEIYDIGYMVKAIK